ncbi:MAG: hypothetical protein FD167_776 [bacterium]|nr:MAG: hypothetical protein FD167_776 [bacterium]
MPYILDYTREQFTILAHFGQRKVYIQPNKIAKLDRFNLSRIKLLTSLEKFH